MTQRVSNFIKENQSFDSEAYKKLTPVLKSAVEDVVSLVKERKGQDIVYAFDEAIEHCAMFWHISQKELLDYFDEEVMEQLGGDKWQIL